MLTSMVTSTATESRELSAEELDQVCGGLTNGDNPFVKAVMEAYNNTILYSSMNGATFPAGTTTGSGGGGGRCHTNHNGVQY